jgi:hypothetical protein
VSDFTAKIRAVRGGELHEVLVYEDGKPSMYCGNAVLTPAEAKGEGLKAARFKLAEAEMELKMYQARVDRFKAILAAVEAINA